MSNYNFSVTLDGLNNINANDIDTDNIVTDYLTVNKNSSVPLVTPYTTNSNQIASCAFVQNALTTNLANYALLNPVTPQTFTGSQNFPTQATTNNTTLVATTAYVKNNLLNYALLGSANTFTANNIFNAITNFNDTLNLNSTSARFSSGANVTSINQNGIAFSIKNLTNNNSIRLNTSNSSGVGQDNVYALNGNTGGLQGDNGNTIDITGTQATIGGTSVPKITTQPLTTSNTNEIASTAFVKTNLLDYVTLSTNQTITGNKTFNGTTTLNNLFINNYVDLTGFIYENQFYGDIYGYAGVLSQNGFYVKDGTGAGATTYALIDSTGNISSSGTISCTDLLSSATGLNIPSASPLLTINNNGTITQTSTTGTNNLFNTIFTATTGNQIAIKAPANNSPSSISQSTNSLVISAVTGNVGSYLSTITLSTRSSTNTGVVILTGNANNITIGGNTTTTNISSPNLNLTSTSISTSATSATITGGLLNIDNSIATFNGNATFNLSTTFNDLLKFYDGTYNTQFGQNANNLEIYTASGNGIKIGSNFTDNIVCSNNRAYLQGSVGNTIDINGTQATIGGTSVPKITTQPLISSNTNEIATTKFVKDQLTTNQTFTGTNTFTNVIPTAPIAIKNTTSSSTGIFIISGSGSYNGINSPDDFSIVATGTGADTGVLTLTTYATGYCGIKISNNTIKFNAPLTCNYYTLPTVPVLNAYDIGHIWGYPGIVFTAWTGFTTPQNVLTVNFNGIGSMKMGIWQTDIVLCTQCTGAPSSNLVWTTVSGTSGDLTDTCTQAVNASVFGTIGVQIMRLSFVLNVSVIPSTYYLNYSRVAGVGSGLSANTTNSKITFTRIG